MRIVLMVCALLILTAVPGFAVGPVNPTLLTWDCPTKNADGTALNDLKEYRIDLSASSATGPWTQVAVVPSATAAPTTGCTATSQVASWGTFAPGQYFVAARACDTSGNCSAEAVSIPFVAADAVPPASPSNLRLSSSGDGLAAF